MARSQPRWLPPNRATVDLRSARGAPHRRRPPASLSPSAELSTISARTLAVSGALGEALADPVTGFTMVYSTEILLLFATLVAIGPLVRATKTTNSTRVRRVSTSASKGLNPGVSAMIRGAIGNIDVAQVVLYAFFALFCRLDLVSRRRGSPRRLSARNRIATGGEGSRLLLIPDAKDLLARKRQKGSGAELRR